VLQWHYARDFPYLGSKEICNLPLCQKSIRPRAGKTKFCIWVVTIPNPFQSRPPCDSTHLAQRSFHHWKQFWKTCFGMVCSCAVAFCMMSSRLLAVSSISGTARNHKEPCQESREPGEPAECRAWPGNPGSGVMNELGRCHDAAASCVRPTSPVSCAELHHEDDGGLLGSTSYYRLA
jgi:hypothetical protein